MSSTDIAHGDESLFHFLIVKKIGWHYTCLEISSIQMYKAKERQAHLWSGTQN